MARLARAMGIVAALAAAGTDGAAQQPVDPSTPRFRAPVDSVSRRDLDRYVRDLRFDTSSAGRDWRRLRWRVSGVAMAGTLIEIVPEWRAHRLSDRQLKRGRVIARVRTSAPVPILGLPQGVSYLWADSVRGDWRWVVIPSDTTEPLRQIPLRYERHARTGPCDRSGARILEAGGLVWVGCGCYACCCVQGTDCMPNPWRPGAELPDVDIVSPRVDTLPRFP